MKDSAFVISRSGRVHDFHCFSLTHDGPCCCPLVLANNLPPRRRPRVLTLDQAADKKKGQA